MSVHTPTHLLDRIRDLVDRPVAAPLETLERTLTDGYAAVLQLEAERMRLEKRIGEVAAELGSGDSARKAREISTLAARLSDADGDLSCLRGLLRSLRTRHAAARAA